jgi:hypothetical protein
MDLPTLWQACATPRARFRSVPAWHRSAAGCIGLLRVAWIVGVVGITRIGYIGRTIDCGLVERWDAQC